MLTMTPTPPPPTTTITTAATRTITAPFLLLLLTVKYCSCQAHPLRAVRHHDEAKPRKDKNLEASDFPLDVLIQHPRDVLLPLPEQEGRNLAVQNRVVGGQTVTDYNKHPYFAEWHGQFCGGALIHDDIVLTGAHCDNAPQMATEIYFRTITRGEQGSVMRTIVEHVKHPNFNPQVSTRDYDYLLLKLDSSPLVDESGNPTGVKIIAMNNDPAIPAAGDPLWGIGYGQIGETIGGMSNTLQDATIFAFSNETCESQYQQYFKSDYMFCSGVEGGGIDTCQGDSGGPIVHQETNTLVGVVSYGIGCARANYAGVNSRVSFAVDWINQTLCSWSNYKKCNGSYAPTPAPNADQSAGVGVSDSTSANPGSITIKMTLDDYPQETSWTLMADSQTLKFVPFESLTQNRMTTSEDFTGLNQNVLYTFKVADSEGDGICCGYGNGSITIYDNVNESNLFVSRGRFGSFYQIDFVIESNGKATLKKQSALYTPSTWPEFETMLGPVNEPFYPGNMPEQSSGAIMVNFDTDDYPEESSWKLSQKPIGNADGWAPIQAWSGEGSPYRALSSVEVNGLQEGWYQFEVLDTQGDGNCCQYGDGYVSLTGPLSAKGGQKGLIWGNNGQYYRRAVVFFHVDSNGYISEITEIETQIPSTDATATGRNGEPLDDKDDDEDSP